MPIDSQTILAIGTTTAIMTQCTKRMLPGDWDSCGVQICGLIALVAVAAWFKQHLPITSPLPWFDLLTLWVQIWASAAGIYETARMTTATTSRSVQKLRAMRDRRVQEAA